MIGRVGGGGVNSVSIWVTEQNVLLFSWELGFFPRVIERGVGYMARGTQNSIGRVVFSIV